MRATANTAEMCSSAGARRSWFSGQARAPSRVRAVLLVTHALPAQTAVMALVGLAIISASVDATRSSPGCVRVSHPSAARASGSCCRACACSGKAPPVPADPTVVATTHGPVRGQLVANDTMALFLGVPYAAPPVGSLRWRAPAPPSAWAEPRNATTQPRGCLGERDTTAEDCLYLNVWVPLTAEGALPVDRPVMLFIHGGAFTGGSIEPCALLLLLLLSPPQPSLLARTPSSSQSTPRSSSRKQDTCSCRSNVGAIAEPDVAAHRCRRRPSRCDGVHGAACAAGRAGRRCVQLRHPRPGVCAPVGAGCAVLARHHARPPANPLRADNIANFGGNASSVLIFGESAGGASVALQVALAGTSVPRRFAAAAMESPGPHQYHLAEDLFPRFGSMQARMHARARAEAGANTAAALTCAVAGQPLLRRPGLSARTARRRSRARLCRAAWRAYQPRGRRPPHHRLSVEALPQRGGAYAACVTLT
jgi:hypothetical protein